jgi:hypothetical protein
VHALILYVRLHPAAPRISGAVMPGSRSSKVVPVLLLLCALLGVSARRGYFAAPPPPTLPASQDVIGTAAISTTPTSESAPITPLDDAGYLIVPFSMTTD